MKSLLVILAYYLGGVTVVAIDLLSRLPYTPDVLVRALSWPVAALRLLLT